MMKMNTTSIKASVDENQGSNEETLLEEPKTNQQQIQNDDENGDIFDRDDFSAVDFINTLFPNGYLIFNCDINNLNRKLIVIIRRISFRIEKKSEKSK